MPPRLHRRLLFKLRYRVSPTSLKTSFSPLETLRGLKAHQWTRYDAQHVLLVAVGIFGMGIIAHPGPLIKTALCTLLLVSLLLPISRQFFLPFLPIIAWLLFWYSCQFIPGEWRPYIWVHVLPTLENIIYGANISNILAAYKTSPLDILAWLPYGIFHYGGPAVCSMIFFVFGPPGTTATFARAFGYMNLIGVFIQVTFPCSPPWYENLYGLAPANYSIPGSPAGLARIDELLGMDLYTSGFTASPMVFGAFPSLHAASATLEALFLSYVFPKLGPVWILYTLWLWWATMYLSHHYAVDLVAGSLLAVYVFYYTRICLSPHTQVTYLPR